MNVQDLTKEQMMQLKRHYLCVRLWENEDRKPTEEELANADSLFSDGVIEEYYEGRELTEEDFLPEA